MRHRGSLWLLWALFVALVAQYSVLGFDPYDTMVILLVVGTLYAYYFHTHEALRLPVRWGTLFGAMAVLFCVQFVLGRFTTLTLGVHPIYTTVVAVAGLFVLPKLFSAKTFFRHVAALSALLGALGLVVWLFVPDALAVSLPLFNPNAGVRSIFARPNTFGLVGVVGCVGTLALFDEKRRPRDGFLALISGWFALSSFSRGVALALAVALAIYFIDTRLSRTLAARCVALVALALVVSVAAAVSLPPESVAVLPFTGRQWLWRAAWAALADSPIRFVSGVGMVSVTGVIRPYMAVTLIHGAVGPHNAYLFVWLRAGVVAAALYVTFIWGSIAVGFRRATPSALLALATAFGVSMVFERYVFWTISIHGVLMTVTFGYLVAAGTTEWATLDLAALKRRVGLVDAASE